MLGRTESWKPDWKKVTAGWWLIGSGCIDLIKQSSATIPAVLGRRLLSQAPELPCCAKLNNDGATGNLVCAAVMVVSRCPMRMEPGKSVPRNLAKAGL